MPDAAQPLAATPLGYTIMELTAKEITMEKRISQNQDLEIARLLPIQTADLDQEALPTANARDLHSFLEAGKDFSTWIKDRIAKFGFIEGQDYVCIESLSSPNLGSSKSRAQRTHRLREGVAGAAPQALLWDSRHRPPGSRAGKPDGPAR